MKITRNSVIEKVLCKFQIETPKNVWIDEFICLKSKMYAFKCGDDSKNKPNVFLSLIQKIINLKNIKIVWIVKNIKTM